MIFKALLRSVLLAAVATGLLACSNDNDDSGGNTTTVTAEAPLAAPTNFKLERESNDLYKFIWDAVPGSNGYRVYLSDTPDVSPENFDSDYDTENLFIELHLPGTNTPELPSYLMVVATKAGSLGEASIVYGLAGSQLTARLNDTGITQCADGTTDGLSCPVSDYPSQDAQFGRDVEANDDSDGHAGFSFTKLDANGNTLLANASSWSCVEDNVTGLTWEVKQGGNGAIGDEGLHDADDTYSWYTTNTSNDGGFAGFTGSFDGGADCHGKSSANFSNYCNTQAFAERVNAQSLCGTSDWRVPSREELKSLVNYQIANYLPAIDSVYFPQTRISGYWSSRPYSDGSSHAWLVIFQYGHYGPGNKAGGFFVRLVRGGQ